VILFILFRFTLHSYILIENRNRVVVAFGLHHQGRCIAFEKVLYTNSFFVRSRIGLLASQSHCFKSLLCDLYPFVKVFQQSFLCE